MGIEISKTLTAKLPPHEREHVAEALWKKCHGVCFLCAHKLIEASQKLVCDHDIPEVNGGLTILDNLNLVHDACNSFKRNHPTVDVRPFLTLAAKIREKGGFL